MSTYKKYWNEERETMDQKKRNELILDRIKEQLQYAYNNLPFYRNLYDKHNFKPEDVDSLEDFTTRVPIIKKSMLVEDQDVNPPFGTYLGNHSWDDIVRIQGSSGTSGRSTFYAVCREDWDRGADSLAMSYWTTGVRPNDTVHVTFPFGLFFGGWGALQGLERLGVTVFPLGATDSKKQIELMMHIKPTVLTGTASYMLHLLDIGQKMGFDMSKSSIRKVISGGEPGASIQGTKRKLAEGWGVDCVHDVASTSEMYPFLTNVECEAMSGPHCITDEVYTEVVNRDDPNVPVPMGERGGIVYTHLWRKSQPMIRFFPGDETYMADDPCPCGRTYPRLPEGIIGRLDDMLIIRGANIYPSAVEKVLAGIKGVGTEFKIIVEKKGSLDEIRVEAELEAKMAECLDEIQIGDLKSKIAAEATEKMTRSLNIRVPVVLLNPGTLDPTIFKARRVHDLRKEQL